MKDTKCTPVLAFKIIEMGGGGGARLFWATIQGAHSVWNEIPWLFTDFSLTKIHFSLTILPRFRARLLHFQPSDTPAFYKYWHKSN